MHSFLRTSQCTNTCSTLSTAVSFTIAPKGMQMRTQHKLIIPSTSATNKYDIFKFNQGGQRRCPILGTAEILYMNQCKQLKTPSVPNCKLFWLSRNIAFATHLDIGYVQIHSKSYVPRKARMTYNLEQRKQLAFVVVSTANK